MTFADLAAGVATWLLAPRPARLVLSVERDGSLVFASEGSPQPGEPPPALRDACLLWEACSDASSFRLRILADPARVQGSVDEPGTLFALHALAAQYTQSRLILRLPPEHVGRRW